jgi:hypothetical protein
VGDDEMISATTWIGGDREQFFSGPCGRRRVTREVFGDHVKWKGVMRKFSVTSWVREEMIKKF